MVVLFEYDTRFVGAGLQRLRTVHPHHAGCHIGQPHPGRASRWMVSDLLLARISIVPPLGCDTDRFPLPGVGVVRFFLQREDEVAAEAVFDLAQISAPSVQRPLFHVKHAGRRHGLFHVKQHRSSGTTGEIPSELPNARLLCFLNL